MAMKTTMILMAQTTTYKNERLHSFYITYVVVHFLSVAKCGKKCGK